MKQNSQKQTQSIGRRIKIACFHISYVSLILGGTHVEKTHVKNIYKITSQLLAMEVGTRQTHGGFGHTGRSLRSAFLCLITEAAETTIGTKRQIRAKQRENAKWGQEPEMEPSLDHMFFQHLQQN